MFMYQEKLVNSLNAEGKDLSDLTAVQARYISEIFGSREADSQLKEFLGEIQKEAFKGHRLIKTTKFIYKPVRDKLLELGYTVTDLPAYTRISW